MDETTFMQEAISWANACKPNKDSIPKVGAILAHGSEVLGRGRRGTGAEGDNEHAEWHALEQVADKTRLPGATLYTTLEPCTRQVRSNELLCCTELILQHEIARVFIGILDPNQGVTGKGLWTLQNHGVEVALFPHTMAEQLRSLNSAFIRTQETLGATILSPGNGDSLRTYETGGKQTIRFKCLNPPTSSTHLFVSREGACWPQPGPFRLVGGDIWEVDAHFGSIGDHAIHIVTASDLGQALIGYYHEVVRNNVERRRRLRDKLIPGDVNLLGGDYSGIPILGLPKGLRSEVSIVVTILGKG